MIDGDLFGIVIEGCLPTARRSASMKSNLNLMMFKSTGVPFDSLICAFVLLSSYSRTLIGSLNYVIDRGYSNKVKKPFTNKYHSIQQLTRKICGKKSVM